MRVSRQIQVYGAWLYQIPQGQENPATGVPGEGWTLIEMRAGRFTEPPSGMTPLPGQVLLLGQGDTMLQITPDDGQKRKGEK